MYTGETIEWRRVYLLNKIHFCNTCISVMYTIYSRIDDIICKCVKVIHFQQYNEIMFNYLISFIHYLH